MRGQRKLVFGWMRFIFLCDDSHTNSCSYLHEKFIPASAIRNNLEKKTVL
jgi:hypothetical protein